MNSNFTTDYRGKLINFNPKVNRNKEISHYNVKISTMIDSCREGRINLSARRGVVRDSFHDV